MAWKSTRQRKWEHNVEVKLLETKDPVGSLWEGFFSKEHWACWAGAACRAFCQRMELYTLFLNSFIIYIICQPALLFPPFLILHRTEDKGLTMGSGVALLQKMPLQTPIPPQHHWVVKLRFSCTAHRVIHYFRKKKKSLFGMQRWNWGRNTGRWQTWRWCTVAVQRHSQNCFSSLKKEPQNIMINKILVLATRLQVHTGHRTRLLLTHHWVSLK